MHTLWTRIKITLFISVVCPIVWADEPQIRHGVLLEREGDIQVQGGLTATYQNANDKRIEEEGLVSVDLVAELPVGNGIVTTYAEANLSPRTNGISNEIPEANGDAGTALDRDGKGRLQISEVHYSRSFGDNSLTIGLLDPDCRLDSSRVANDETRQFLSTPFVNNPTIAFPDYSLGACMHIERTSGRPGMNLLLTSSHGLADNPDVSYSELFDIGASGKGVFIGTELYWQKARNIWRVGLWQSTADTSYIDGSGQVDDNYGIYMSSDHKLYQYQLNIRLGMANSDVSEVSDFIGLALETDVTGHTLGAALARTGVSKKIQAKMNNRYQSELYLRYAFSDGIQLTPSLQWIKHSKFDTGDEERDEDMLVFSFRVSYLFQ
ncbi:carbohydrate porin [Thiohalophilus thiocyanatoxydans]|uniref:Carbohydrate-selective porin (OprB family) n=1 Tax=Thiohalophilus thiocyanatoxydans TaxID=381308 RepID=A0A4R8IRJ8_9GAMM|nr:carbohydrate porin [Thiohalophilus thiocyanatoxydans]TDY03652.1 carbohydrate-selective porin (OprB family) [Thiohalophilus thiocyanatoxydans]